MSNVKTSRYAFQAVLGKSTKSVNTLILNPHIHLMGDDSACIAYVRLTQFMDKWVATHSHSIYF